MPIYPSGNAAVDDVTLEFNAQNQIAQIQTFAPPSSITYSSNTTLTKDVYAKDVTINSGVTLTTNGYNFYCTGTFTNSGTIDTGATTNGGGGGGGGGAGANGLYIQAQSIIAGTVIASGQNGGTGAGGGGGGGGGVILLAYSNSLTAGSYSVNGGTGGAGSGAAGGGEAGGAGGNTANATGGAGGTTTPTVGGTGAASTAPTITNSLIQSWAAASGGIATYLRGAGGGGGGNPGTGVGGTGGSVSGYGGSGGGGGGAVTSSGGGGGIGGAGLVLTYQYTSVPISISTLLSITLTGSPFVWTNNTQYRQTVYVSGGTISSLLFNSIDLTSCSQFVLAPGDNLNITYSSTPTMVYQQV